jgi:hypothetical protein
MTQNYPYEEWDMIYHPTYGEMQTVQVQDIGDIYLTWSSYWIDLYWGDDQEAADEYGTRWIDYHY